VKLTFASRKGDMRIFLCSTFEDLQAYRRAAMEVLMECEHLYRGMEFFGATQYEALETCLQNVRSADRVVVLVGTRYGSRPSVGQPSFTELEIREAENHELPIQVYCLDVERQPVLARFVDGGEDGLALSKLKDRLSTHYTTDTFTTPEDLARRLARDFLREERRNLRDSESGDSPAAIPRFRETSYDALAEWYDIWYKGHWRSEEPVKTLTSIIRSYFEGSRGNITKLRFLDCACGTGNTFAAFTRQGYEIYGTDGSREMLRQAQRNCQAAGLPTDRLVMNPINWTDGIGYKEQFGDEGFDVVVNTANSFCHIPPVPEYMGTALRNFWNLLKPGGLLVIDTKKYVRGDHQEDGIETYQELRYLATSQEWIVRSQRHEVTKSPELGEVHFHTRLLYDDDPAFGTGVRRALIVVTIYGGAVTPRVLVVPYYPLPARLLEKQMITCGFLTATHPALEKLAVNWKYDVVIGQKPVEDTRRT
jgi:SAM-dependent methyltransferase